MTPQIPDMHAIVERLEKLEGQNRSLRQVLVVVALALGALAFMGQTKGTPNVLSARKFILLDSQGRTRAILQPDQIGGAALTLLDASGHKRVVLDGATGPTGDGFGYLQLGKDAEANDAYPLASWNTGATLSNAGLIMRAYPGNRKAGSVLLEGPGTDGPALELRDSEGFEIDLGKSGTFTAETGATKKTSAASIIMFGNDSKHHVIWLAP